MPENVKKILAENVEKFSFYPDPNCTDVIKAISDFENIPEKNILCGNSCGGFDLSYSERCKSM